MKIDTKYQWFADLRKPWLAGSSKTRHWAISWKGKKRYLHRCIWALENNIPYSEVPMLDHINRDTSDNRLCNLRPTNKILNSSNSDAFSKGDAQFRNGKWTARARHRGKRYHLGLYPTEAMARLISRGVKTYLMVLEEAVL